MNESKINDIDENPKSLTFFEQVYAIVARIPRGKVISYGQIARMLGRPRAAREVGWALSNCPDELPWQRVVMADGSVTGGVFVEIRRGLLQEEDISFLPDGRVNMELHNWDGNVSDYKKSATHRALPRPASTAP